jgi:thiopeptide-type bacteriocin biosynthesis protein
MRSSSSSRSSADDTLGRRWLQANLELDNDGAAHLRAIWEPIATTVDSLAEQGLLRCFYFLRKPPGLRLRFAVDATAPPTVSSAIEAVLDELITGGLVARWYPSVYEPEVYKFGGPSAMDAVHDQFFADSACWWRWDQLVAAGETAIDARLLSVTVLNDLFRVFTGGPEEVWDVWCRLATMHGDRVAMDGQPAPAVAIADIVERVSAAEAELLRAYATSNAELAGRFRALLAEGKLLFAHRLVLPHVALYHWNRYGFTPSDRASMYTRMMRAWSPHD